MSFMRILRCLLVPALLAGTGIASVRADEYPTKPIRFVVGFLPGAATDLSARVVAEAISSKLGQQVVVENKPGAGSMIAAEFVSKSAPDGYTLFMGNSDGVTVLPAVSPAVPYKVPDGFSYISRFLALPVVLAINPELPIKSMADLVAYAKANPGKLRYGTSGVGGIPHLTTLLFEQQAGIKLTHVPYKGVTGVLQDILGGFVDMGFLTLSTVGPYAKSGKVRLIAMTGSARDPLWPDVPTIGETGYPGSTVEVWYGMLAPPGLPPAVQDKLTKAVTEALGSEQVKERLAAASLKPAPLAGDSFKTLISDEFKRWKTIATDANIKVD